MELVAEPSDCCAGVEDAPFQGVDNVVVVAFKEEELLLSSDHGHGEGGAHGVHGEFGLRARGAK